MFKLRIGSDLNCPIRYEDITPPMIPNSVPPIVKVKNNHRIPFADN